MSEGNVVQLYDREKEAVAGMMLRANDFERVAKRYAAELVDKIAVPHTYEEAVTMIAVAYLEGSMAQLKWARDLVRGDGETL